MQRRSTRLSTAARNLLAILESLELKRDNLIDRMEPILSDPLVQSAYASFATQFSRLEENVELIRSIQSENDEQYLSFEADILAAQQSLNKLLEALQSRLANSPAYSSVLDMEAELLARRQELRNTFVAVSGETIDAVNLFDRAMAKLREAIDESALALQDMKEVPEDLGEMIRELHILWTSVDVSMQKQDAAIVG